MIAEDYYDSIVLIVRKPHEIKDPKVVELVVKDFKDLGKHRSQMDGHDFYCSLGTTRKKAGSKDAFLEVDVNYPMEFARIAKSQKDFHQLLVVTAVGADSSSMFFYNKAKGQLEDQLQALHLKALKIFQPSLLLGNRTEARLLEEIAKLLSSIASFFTFGSKKRVGAISDIEVAKTMIKIAVKEEAGFHRYKPNQIVNIAHST